MDNELTLAGYDRIGRVKGVIDKTVAQAFAEAVARGEAPKDQGGATQRSRARLSFRIWRRSIPPASSCAAWRRASKSRPKRGR